MVAVLYGRRETWENREEAARFYLEAALSCEGAEKERYANILSEILAGEEVCSDGYDTGGYGLPDTYAEIEYEDMDSPEAILGARFDDMNYLRYMER